MGLYVRLACARHLRDLETAAARNLIWSPEHANHKIRFYRFLKHSKGDLGGQTIELGLWQKFIVGSVHGWRWATGPRAGRRRFRIVMVVVAKKNGKSTMLAGAGIDGLIADGEEGAEVYAAATKKDQARQVFDAAVQMVRRSPLLLNRLDVSSTAIVDFRTGSTFKPLSADADGADGSNPHVSILDELHRHKTRAMLNLLQESMGARSQPLLWIITTVGDDRPGTPYANEEDYAIKVLEGTIQDDSYFAYLATLDRDDDWSDEKNWIKANPNLGVSVNLEDLRDSATKARGNPDALSNFKRLRLNIRTAAQDRAIDMTRWAALKAPARKTADLAGRVCYGGLDASSKVDISAWLRLYAPRDKGGVWTIKTKFWIPLDNIEERASRDRAPYADWVKRGLIRATPGNIVDHDEIEAAVLADHKEHAIDSVAYDPWGISQMAARLNAKGVPMAEFNQRIANYAPASNEFEALVAAGKLEHDGDEVLAWMASNLHWLKDGKLNKMPHKGRSTGRIDGMSGLLMAIGRACAVAEAGSVYAERGLLVIEA